MISLLAMELCYYNHVFMNNSLSLPYKYNVNAILASVMGSVESSGRYERFFVLEVFCMALTTCKAR